MPDLALRFAWRVLRGREGWRDLKDRLLGPPSPPPGSLWVHGASVGELASAKPLIEAWAQSRTILVTANTVTGRDRVANWRLPGVAARLAPLDFSWTQRRILGRCAGLVVLENELWPNRLLMAHRKAVPVAIVGARLSERSAAAWSRRGAVAQAVLGPIAALSAQNAASEARFRALGLPEERILPQVDLKSLYAPEPVSAPLPGWQRDTTVLFASTHSGEEAVLLEAFSIAQQANPALRAILAPRHPERGAEVARLMTGLGFDAPRRSDGQAPEGPIYLADTLGEMAAWYAAAAVTFVGGSLVPKGGHTPYEPCAHGSAILHGPHVENFAAVYGRLAEAGGAEQVQTAQEIARGILRHLTTSPLPAAARTVLAPKDSAEDLARSVLALVDP